MSNRIARIVVGAGKKMLGLSDNSGKLISVVTKETDRDTGAVTLSASGNDLLVQSNLPPVNEDGRPNGTIYLHYTGV